jgi:bifunctional non-homologous end joining protein LigD
VLEIHSWGSRIDSLDKPDQIVIDLDPDVSIEWKTLADSAQEIREFLKGIGLESFLKCTGGKGLHVVVPIRAEHEWPVIKEFSQALVRRMEAKKPERYVTKMSKAVRKNHIFLDYLRNDRDATAIAPFSPRARAGAPVALPLDWKELSAHAMPVFRVTDFAKWKKRLDRDRWAKMRTLRQRLSPDLLRAAEKSTLHSADALSKEKGRGR